MTMQLLRHVAYQSMGGPLAIANQPVRGRTLRNDSGFAEADTEIHRIVMNIPTICVTCCRGRNAHGVNDSAPAG